MKTNILENIFNLISDSQQETNEILNQVGNIASKTLGVMGSSSMGASLGALASPIGPAAGAVIGGGLAVTKSVADALEKRKQLKLQQSS